MLYQSNLKVENANWELAPEDRGLLAESSFHFETLGAKSKPAISEQSSLWGQHSPIRALRGDGADCSTAFMSGK